MPSHLPTTIEEVDQLLLNARLRDEMEPFYDEAVDLVESGHMTTSNENDYLASLLEWERAPVLPIYRWFQPPLELPHPQVLSDAEIHQRLWQTIHRLHEQHIAVAYTDHLSDRQLYCVLYRDILPAAEKKLERRSGYLYWFCMDADEEPEIWLRYYASEPQRQRWAWETGRNLPPREPMPHPRTMPGPPPPV